MPIPVISATSSYLGFKRNEAFAFQPSATNTPLTWEASGLPAGVTIDTPATFATTGVASTDVVTGASSAYANGDKVFFPTITGGAGLVANTVYFVRDVAGATFKLSATLGGLAINFTTDITDGTIKKVSTGMIFGSVAVQGPYVFAVTASNGDGASAAREFTLGISSGSATTAGSADVAMDLAFDVASGLVAFGTDAPMAGVEVGTDVVAYIKSGDVRLFALRAFKNGVQIDPDFTSLRMVFKEFDPEAVLITADVFEKEGEGASAYWNLKVSMVPANVDAALSNYEADAGTGFPALAEIEWKRDVTFDGTTLEIVGTTRTFNIALDREMAKAA